MYSMYKRRDLPWLVKTNLKMSPEEVSPEEVVAVLEALRRRDFLGVIVIAEGEDHTLELVEGFTFVRAVKMSFDPEYPLWVTTKGDFVYQSSDHVPEEWIKWSDLMSASKRMSKLTKADPRTVDTWQAVLELLGQDFHSIFLYEASQEELDRYRNRIF